MADWRDETGKGSPRWHPFAAAVLAFALTLAVTATVDLYQRRGLSEAARAALIGELSQIRARLEGVINGNLLAISGLGAVIAAEPRIDQTRFARVARGLFDDRQVLRNIAGAPGLVLSLVYPMAGNEAALGLDYRSHPIQAEAVLRAAQTGQPVVAGPLPLVQGGSGLIVRKPVFLPAEAPGEARPLWGLISAVLDTEVLYRLAGLPEDGRLGELDLAIRGRDGTGPTGEVFYGDPDVFGPGAVRMPVSLPGGSWELAARRVSGAVQDEGLLATRLAGGALALLLGLMAFQLTRNRQALQDGAARLRGQMNRLNAAEAIAHVGHWEYRVADGRIRWSDETYRIFGVPPQSQPPDLAWIDRHLHPDDRSRHADNLERMLAADPGDSLSEQRYRILGEDGEQRRVAVWVEIEFDRSGRPAILFGTVQDISQQHRAEERIRQMNQELEQRVRERTRALEAANRQLETFTYSVSHDLKAPLRGIDGYSRLLLEDHLDRLDDEGRSFLNNIRRGAVQMAQLIDDLLAYSRMERRDIQDNRLVLRELVDRLVAERDAELSARGVEVEIGFDGLELSADREGLTLVLRNLIDNALKFTREQPAPRVRIDARIEEGLAVLTVGDNGIGFDMRFRDRIFEIFQRLQRAEDYPGTGVGLAIVRKAVQRMGGQVWAESRPGEGARFVVELPQ
jgi:sensor domain CHASE-containing protein/nitrogen-specific signal transduction histidine kinase